MKANASILCVGVGEPSTVVFGTTSVGADLSSSLGRLGLKQPLCCRARQVRA
jgi:hypothetical protein